MNKTLRQFADEVLTCQGLTPVSFFAYFFITCQRVTGKLSFSAEVKQLALGNDDKKEVKVLPHIFLGQGPYRNDI